MPTAHSNKIGGSSAKRIIACPYSMAAPKHPQPESPFAAEGTYLHDVMEGILRDEIDEEFLLEHPGMTEELLDEKINPALDAFDELTDLVIEDEADDWEVFLPEAEYHFTGDLEGCFGTGDFMGRYKKTVVSLDWKFGDGVVVHPEENEQGLFYLGAAMDTMPELFEGVEEIIIAIIQPRRGMAESESPLHYWKTTVKRVVEFRDTLSFVLKEAEGNNPPAATGEHCKFCDHKPLCPHVNGMVSTALLAQPNAMTPEELGAAMSQAAVLEGYIKDIMKLGQAVLEEGGEVPGWKMVAKRANRKWTDEAAVEKKLKNMKVSLTDCKARPKLKTPAQVEKVVAKAGKDFGKFADLISKESSGNVMAPESDKRPAVEILPKQLDELAAVLDIQ